MHRKIHQGNLLERSLAPKEKPTPHRLGREEKDPQLRPSSQADIRNSNLDLNHITSYKESQTKIQRLLATQMCP